MAKILIKRSSTQGNQPSAQVLSIGELALNTADKKIFFKHTDESIHYLQALYESSISELADVDYGSTVPTDGDILKWDGGSLKWVPVTPEPPLTVINTDQQGDPATTVEAVESLKFDYEFTVTDGEDGTATVQYGGAFKSITVADQGTLTALDNTNLEIEAGTNAEITTDQETQKLTMGVISTPSFTTVTLNETGYIEFSNGTRQFSKAPRIYTNADAELGLTLDDLLPGDYYYDDTTESIYIMIDTGLGYNQLLDLTVRA
jgi:hypothetical protein